MSLPAVLHWDLNHYVVLVSIKGKTATINDPSAGERRLSLEDVSKHYTGVAVEMLPAADFVRGEQKRNFTR